jgi:hypothetical protein
MARADKLVMALEALRERPRIVVSRSKFRGGARVAPDWEWAELADAEGNWHGMSRGASSRRTKGGLVRGLFSAGLVEIL